MLQPMFQVQLVKQANGKLAAEGARDGSRRATCRPPVKPFP